VNDVPGAVREIYADPAYLDVTLPAGQTFEQPVTRGHTGILYVYRGEVTVGGASPGRGKLVPSPRLAILGDGDVVRVHAGAAPARFLLLSAQPLHEPAARYGPFVMNTPQQIQEAFKDFHAGRMGKIPADVA